MYDRYTKAGKENAIHRLDNLYMMMIGMVTAEARMTMTQMQIIAIIELCMK